MNTLLPVTLALSLSSSVACAGEPAAPPAHATEALAPLTRRRTRR